MDSVEEAPEFVAAAGLTPPYLLAGHSYGGLVSLLYAVAYPDEVSGILLADALLPIVAELDAQYLTPEERETLRVADNDNREHLDVPDGLIEAGPMLADLPAVPITYMSATLRPPVPEWPVGAYESALQGFIESLPMGKLVECRASHFIPREIPDQVASEIEELLGR